jgi:hypothetical protein
MKKYFLAFLVLTFILAGCGDVGGPRNVDDHSLMNGAIVVNDNPNVGYEQPGDFPDGNGRSAVNAARTASRQANGDPSANDYYFKLVGQTSSLIMADGTILQATEVRVDDGYAFVSYNFRGPINKGGIVVFKYTVSGSKMEDVKVNLTPVSSIVMPRAQINAIDYDGSKLYLAGASNEPAFGYVTGEAPAFFMVMELDGQKQFKLADPVIKKLGSYQASSIRKKGDRIYIVTGDGADNTDGGLYIYDASSYSQVNFIDMKLARAVDVDNNGIYVMQANPARVTSFNSSGGGQSEIYNRPGEGMQREAKSEILAWNNYLFVTTNETGLRMLNKDGTLNESLDAPCKVTGDTTNDVTNGVSVSTDIKMNASVSPNRAMYVPMTPSGVLLLANGEQGLYWYDITNFGSIVASENNSILSDYEGSANSIASRGNVVFLAHGLGGLKVLYFGLRSAGISNTVVITGINWNNGAGNGNGDGINQFTVDGITLKNNKNNVTPAVFDAEIAGTTPKVSAIYCVDERTVDNTNGYTKVYAVRVAFFKGGEWVVYAGEIPVGNPGGNDKNLNYKLTME